MKVQAFFVVLLALAGVSFSLTSISSCAILNQSGETYQLTASISGAPNTYYGGSTTCIQINGSDILLDCQGFNVTATGNAAVAIEWPGNNVTVRNCGLNNAIGIDILGLRNSNLSNNQINPSYAGISGVLSFGGGDMNNVISYNNITGGSYGIWEPPDNTRVSNNRLLSQSSVSLIIGGANITAVSNHINGSSGYGMQLRGSELNVSNNIVANSTERGIQSSSYNFTLSGNNISSSGQYGLQLGNSDYRANMGAISFNRITGGSSYGLFVESSSDLNITNNVISGNALGIYVSQGWGEGGPNPTYNISIRQNSISNNSGEGIFLSSVSGTSFISNNVTFANGNGFTIEYSDGILVDPSYFCNNTGYGLLVNLSTNVNVTDSVFCNNTLDGLKILHSSYILVNDSTAFLNANNGISMENATYSNVTGIVAYDNGWSGFFLQDPDAVRIDNSSAYNNTNGVAFLGYYISGPTMTTLTGNNLTNNAGSGVLLNSSTSNKYNVTLAGNVITGNPYGISIPNGYASANMRDNLIANNTISGYQLNNYFGDAVDSAGDRFLGNGADIAYPSGGSGFTLTLADVLLGSAGANYAANVSIDHVGDHPWGNITWVPSPSPPAAGLASFANKSIDLSYIPYYFPTTRTFNITMKWTASEGSAIDESTLEMWLFNESGSFLLNNTPNLSSRSISTSVTFSDANNDSVVGLYFNETPALGNCPIISASGTYTQSQNYVGAINSQTGYGGLSCVKIGAPNVIFDCNGFNITNNGTAGSTYGIFLNSSATNAVVKNCPSISGYSDGLFLYGSAYGNFTNISVPNAATAAFYVSGGRDNTFTSSYGNASGYGFYLSSTINNVFMNNTVRSSNQYGAIVTSSNNNSFTNTSIINCQYGFSVPAGANNSFFNNTMVINSGGYGFSVSGSENRIIGNSVNNSAYAYYFSGSPNNVIINNSAFNSSNYGLFFTSSSFNQTVINNTLQESRVYDFFIVVSNAGCAHTVQNNTGSANRPIMFANTSVSWSNLEASEVFLCNADNSILNNVTANGSDTLRNNGFFMFLTDNSSVNNSVSGHNYYGFYLDTSNGNNLTGSNSFNDSQGYAYYLLGSSNNRMSGNRANHSANGFYIYSASNNNILSNNTANASSVAFYLYQVSGNNITNCTAISPGNYGFYLYTASNGTIADNSISAAYGAYISYYSNNNTITNNSMSSPNEAFHLSLSSHNRISNGGIRGYATGRGVFLESASENNTIANLSLSNFSYGIWLFNSNSGNNFTGNTICNNSYGTTIRGANRTVLANEHFCNNGRDFWFDSGGVSPEVTLSSVIFDSPAGNLVNFTNLSLSDIAAAGSSYLINWSGQNAALPADRISFAGKFVNISNLTGTVSIDTLTWSWLDSELSGFNDSHFELWKHNSTGNWTNLNATLNASANTLNIGNLNPASDYGILQDNSTICAIPANDYLVNASTTFCSGTYYINDTGSTGIIIANANSINIICDNTTIIGSGSGSGIYASSKRGMNISGCTILNYGFGINLNLVNSSGIFNNTVENMTSHGIYNNLPLYDRIFQNTIRNTTDAGISLYHSGNSFDYGYSIVDNNTISGPAAGHSIYMQGSAGVGQGLKYVNVTNNVFGNSSYGITVAGYNSGAPSPSMHYNRFINNTCINTSYCVNLYHNGAYGLKYSVFDNNTFRDSAYGVYIQGTGDYYISENNFTNNKFESISAYGVFFTSANNYKNRFWGSNTFDGNAFYHYYGDANFAANGLTIDVSPNATNLCSYTAVMVNRFNVTGSTFKANGDCAFYSWDSDNVQLRGNNISNATTGVWLYLSTNGTVRDNNIQNTSSSGIYDAYPYWDIIANNSLRNTTTAGIYLFKDSPATTDYGFSTVANNTVDGPAAGYSIYLHGIGGAFQGIKYVNVTGNRLGNSTYGLFIFGQGTGAPTPEMYYNRIINNTITNTTRSINLYATGDNGRLRYNTFENNTLQGATNAIYLDGTGDFSVGYNNFSGNNLTGISQYGVFFTGTNHYKNSFWGLNTFEGRPFYHFFGDIDASVGGITVDVSKNATNLCSFTAVRVNRFNVTNSTFKANGDCAFYSWDSNNTLFAGSNVTNATTGAWLYSSVNNTVRDSIIQNTTSSAIFLNLPTGDVVANNAISNATTAGIYLLADSVLATGFGYSLVENNTINGPAAGQSILLQGYSQFSLQYVNATNNTFGNSTYGLYLYAQGTGAPTPQMHYNRIVGNRCVNATTCYYIYASGDSGNLRYNLFENNTAQSPYGISIGGTGSGGVTNNNFTSNTLNCTLYPIAISTSAPANNRFLGNILENDNQSNFLSSSAVANNFTNTTFARNQGRINFPQTISLAKSVNTVNTVLNTDIASINSTALPEFAIPANVTSYAPQCPAVIYYRTGFPLTSAQVISGGSVCTGPQCTPVSCANNSATFSVADFSGYTANVTNCMVINASGTYTMAMNFSGAPYDASPFVGYACIKIAASDVAFDCQGYSITGTDNSTPTFGIAINGSSGTPLTNITIRNCLVSNYTYGINGEYSDFVTVNNATAYGNNETGIYIAYSSNASFANDTAYSNRRGFEVLASDSNLSNGTAYGNADHGFYSLGDVWYVSSAAYSNGGTGFRTEGSGAVIANCTAYLNAGRGIAIVGSSNATVTGCAAWSNSGDGFYEEYHGSSVLSDNTAFGNGGSGFNLTGGNDVILGSNRMYNNTYDFRTGTGSFNMTANLFLNPSGSLANYTNLSINDSVGPGESYYAVWSALPAALPGGKGSFENKYLNITVMSGAPSIDSAVWHWLDSELANHTESRLALWKYNSSGWSNAGAQLNAASNSLNISNLNPASTYAILEQLCTVPTNDYLVNASTTFCPGTYYLNDSGSTGIIIANANSINITCDGTVIIGNGAGTGILLSGRSGVRVQGCTVSNYGTGILLYDSSSNTLHNNTIINSTRGVQLHSRWGTQSNMVQNNTISGGSSGVYFTSDGNYPGDLSFNDVSYNAIRDSGAGIDIVPTFQVQSQAQFNTFRFNNITNCTRAISFAPAAGYCDISYNTFSGNILRDGQYGVYFDEYYGRNWEVYRNNFTNNTMFNFSQYAAYFNNDETYGNHFACNNTLDGYMFCHYAYSTNVVDSNLSLNASNDVTNLGIYSIVRSTNVTLANSTLRNDRHFGAFLWDNAGSRILNVTMLNNGDAGDESNIYMFSEDNSLVSNCSLNGSNHGVGIFSSSGIRVNVSTIANAAGDAVYIYESSSNTVNNDSIYGSGGASVLLYSRFGNANSNLIQNNTISGGTAGVRFTSDTNYPGDLSNNDVSFNRISNSADGIHIFPAYEVQSQTQFNTFRSNNITNCTRAITLNTTSGYCDISYNTFSGNILRDGQYGVYFDEYYGRNWEVYRNNFTNNTMFNFSQYAAYFNNDETYGNHFACNNTLDGYMFCHYAYALNAAENGLSLNTSNDVTNLGLFSIVRSTNVTLANSTLRNDRHFGAFLWDNAGSRILNVTMLNNGDAGDESNVYMNSEDNSIISNSTMNGSSHGVIMFASTGNRINSSSLANPAGEAIFMYESSSNVVNNDTISGSGGASIRLHSRFGNANSNVIQNSTISGGAAGVRFTSDANYPGDLSGNDISFNAISNSADCIHMSPTYEIQSQTEYNAVRFNNLSNCTRALSLSPLSGGNTVRYNLFEDNNISSSSYGIYLGEAAGGGNEITWNNFSRNTVNATLYPVYVANTEPLANRFFNSTLTNDNASNFIYNPGTSVNYTNTTFVRNQGRINFPQAISLAKSVNTVNTVLNTDIASINSTALPEFAIPANVTSYAPQCPAVIYYRTGFPPTSAQVISGGSVCTGPQCTPVSCSANLATFSVANFSGYTANVTNCMVINASGTYTMTANFTGAPNDASEVIWGSNKACIKIASSDVVLECNGYSITNDGTTSAAAIIVNGTSGGQFSNITIRNCILSSYEMGILAWHVNNGTFTGNNISNLTWAGIQSNAGGGNRIINNTATDVDTGFAVDVNGSGNTITGNLAVCNPMLSNGTAGFWFNMTDSLVDNNSAIGFYRGFRITTGDNNTLTNNAAANGTGDGFRVSSRNSRFANNAVSNQPGSCFRLDPVPAGPNYATYRNNLTNNTATNCTTGFYLYASYNNTLSDNRAYNSGADGFYLQSGSNSNVLANNTAFNSTQMGFNVQSSHNNNLTGNNAGNNSNHGIYLVSSNDNTLVNNTAYGNPVGFGLYSGQRNRMYNDTASMNSGGFSISESHDLIYNASASFASQGISIYGTNITVNRSVAFNNSYAGFRLGSTNSTIANSLAYNNSPYGFYVYSDTNGQLVNNTAFQNQRGYSVGESSGVYIADSVAFANSYSGAEVFNSNRTLFRDCHYYSNANDLYLYDVSGTAFIVNLSGVLFDNPLGNMQNYTNLSLNDTIAIGGYFVMNWSAQPPAGLPPGRATFANKHLNISRVSGTDSLDRVAWLWTNAESAGLNESRFELWKYNGTWSRLNNTPSVSVNELSLYVMNPASTYSILQLNDSVAPVVVLNSPDDNAIFNITLVTFNFTATDDAATTMNCSLYLDGSLNQSNASTQNNTPAAFMAIIPQGIHTWNVTCLDEAYNPGISATRNFTIDTTAPVITLNAPADNYLTNLTSVAFNFTAVDSLSPTMNCSLYVDSLLEQSNASTLNSTATTMTRTLTQGLHTWYIRCTDLANNTNQSVSRNLTVDTLAPIIALNSPPQDFLTNGTSVTFNFTAIDSLSPAMNCSLFIDSVLNSTNASTLNSTATTFIVSAIPQGLHTWYVLCTDLAGNTNVSASRNFTIDASGPSSITLNSPPDDFLTNSTSVTFNFTAIDSLSPAMNCSLFIDSVLNSTNASTLNSTATTFIVSAIPQGLHTWYVLCTDLAGNTNVSASRNFTIDASAPSVTLNLPADTATLYSTSSAFNFTATDNLTPALNCTFILDGSPGQSNASVINNTLTNFLVAGLSGGPHNWSVLCSDGINYGSSPVRSFYVDIQAPAIDLNSPNQSAVLNSSTVAFNFTATDDHAANLNCSIYLDSVLEDSSPSVPSGSPFVFTISGIADGNHTWFVNCSDGGNSNASAIRTFNVSTAVPTQPDDDDDDDRPLDVSASTSCNGTIVTVESRHDPVSNAEVRVDGSLIGTTNSSGQEAFDGCGKSVEIRASKPGYSTATETIQLIGCESCEIIPPEPPENLTCDCGEAINGACVPFQCCSDASCKGSERCDIPTGNSGGQCRPVTGDCGEALNHTFVPFGYECGAESGCPSCPQGERCQAHACLSNDLIGPQSGFVGENSTVHALEDGAPCALCDVVVTDPLGRNLSGKTNPDGTFILPLALKGAYTVSLLRDGIAVRSLVINALPKSEPIEPPKPPVILTEDWSWLLWALILLALIFLGLIYWRRRKEKEKPKMDKPPKK